ncbi:MAG: T9SS type A sorting domain-containing protein [Bacteroidales bacterium]
MKKLFYNITSFIRYKSSANLFFLLFFLSGHGWSQTSVNENAVLSAAKANTISNLSANTLDNQLKLNVVSPNGTSDETIIYFKSENSNGVDLNDALYLVGGNPLNTLLYSYINSEKYCINALATYSAPISVNLGFEPKVNGNFSFTANEIQSFSEYSSVILKDLKTNYTQDLRINPIYNFNANTTDIVNRFQLYFNLAYTWNVASGNWNTAASWKPARTSPSSSDILVFDGSLQPSPIVNLDFPSPQSIGTLRLAKTAVVVLASNIEAKTLIIGVVGLDRSHFKIDSAASLTVNATNAVTLNLASGFKANISGNLIFQNEAHRLIAADTNGITFSKTAIFKTGPGFSGDAFGTTNLKNAVFENGSLYIHKSLAPPLFNGRVFSDFEMDAIGFNNNIAGNLGVTMDNFTITNAIFIGMNLSGIINIKGNLVINNGNLSFSPATTASVIFNGTSVQTVSAGIGSLTIASNANFIIDNSVIIDRDISFGGSLTINPAKALTVSSGKQLSVTSGLLIRSDVSGTGSLIHSNAVNGSMERYIAVMSANDFHILSSPVTAQLINAGFSPENQSFFAWNESNGSWLPFENAGFTALNGSNLLTPGKGYSVSYSATSTKIFTGTFNQGTLNTNLTYSPGAYSGWNLLANPYPSAINWNINAGFTRNMLEDAGFGDYAYWIWNPINGNYGTFISNGSFGTNGVTNYIASCQGFWVKTTSATTFSMNNLSREHCISQPWLKTTTASENTLRLKVTTTENTYSDEMIVNIGSPNGLGGAEKMFSRLQTAPDIFSTKQNNNWSINNLSTIIATTIVPVGFKAGVNGNYSITANGINSFTTPTYIYLKDLKTNTICNLNEHNEYSFTATTYDERMRFQLIFALSPLSVINNSIQQHTAIYSYDGNIYINSNESIKEITIYNTLGQLVKRYENFNGNVIIPMCTYKFGYYIVKMLTDQKVYTEKLLLN